MAVLTALYARVMAPLWQENGAPSSLYYYRVRAYNHAGSSSYTNVAQAVTEDPIQLIEEVAESELIGAGTVTGTYADTWTDGVYEVIKERNSGGKRQNRYSYLQHKWVFNVTGGNMVTFFGQFSNGPVNGR